MGRSVCGWGNGLAITIFSLGTPGLGTPAPLAFPSGAVSSNVSTPASTPRDDGCRRRAVLSVSLDELEDRAAKYIGHRVRVSGVVQRVLGPRAFRIDEEGWTDLGRELLVIVPGELVASLRENDAIIVDGLVRKFVRAELEREHGWTLPEPRPGAYAGPRPVILADCVIGRDDGRAIIARQDTGTAISRQSGPTTLGPPLTNLLAVATGTADIVGRVVDLRGVRVAAVADERGFYLGDAEKQVFVMWDRSDRLERVVRPGLRVSVRGMVSRMTPELAKTLRPPGILNRDIYLYATTIE
ncbi:MAG: hypothetical protein AB7O32_11590 [Vicinamibacterales bacterium]